MIIFMAGLPYSGKSFIVERLKPLFNAGDIIISPRDYIGPDFESMNEQEKSNYNISAWEVSMEVLEEKTKNTFNDRKIIYDTCCTSYTYMEKAFLTAKHYAHDIAYVFVVAGPEICVERSKGVLTEKLITKYQDSFERNLAKFKKISNRFITINNDVNEEPNIKRLVDLWGVHAHKI